MIGHLFRVAKSLIREKAKKSERSHQWPAVEHHFLAANPTCAACGSTKTLQVHHVQPFHLFPALELEPSNLIALCMGPNECHLRIGHAGSFKAYNPNVREDAALRLKAEQDKDTAAAQKIVGMAKQARRT